MKNEKRAPQFRELLVQLITRHVLDELAADLKRAACENDIGDTIARDFIKLAGEIMNDICLLYTSDAADE